MVQDGSRGHAAPAADQGGHPVHVPHQRTEVAVLGIVAMGIEVGRTVRVREGSGVKGVGNEMVDAPHQKVVRQILFQPHPLRPAVVAEDLAHGPTLLAGLDGRGGGR